MSAGFRGLMHRRAAETLVLLRCKMVLIVGFTGVLLYVRVSQWL
jgi:hypothetical protein